MRKYRVRKYRVNPNLKNLLISLVPGKQLLEYFLLTQIVCLMSVAAGMLYGASFLLSYFTGIILSIVLGIIGIILYHVFEQNEGI